MKTFLLHFTSLKARIAVLCAALVLALGGSASAVTYTPTIFTDPAVTGGVNSATGVITGGAGAGQVSLRSAVIAANATGGTNSISLGAGTYQLTIPGTGETAASGDATIGDLDVLAPASGTNTLTVQGAGAGSTTIQQTSGVDRVFDLHPVNVAGSITFNLNDVTVTGGVSTSSAGAILAGRAGDVTALTNCVFNGNTATSNGGVISQSSGGASHNLTITNCVFNNNTATNGGGGAVNYSGLGNVTITGCTFTGNTAGAQGGALNISGTGSGPVTTNILRNNFSNNTANGTQFGGAAMASTNAQTINFNFNRLVGNTSPNLLTSGAPPNNGDGRVITAAGGVIGTLDADNNWWGVNTGPVTTAGSRSIFSTAATTGTKWLQLRNSASPATINVASTSTVSADIFGLNTGGSTAASNLTGLPAFPAAGTVFGNAQKGTIPGGNIQFVNGAASVVFTATAAGGGGVDATADSQTVTAAITVNSPPSNNADLSALTTTASGFAPPFAAGTTTGYTATVLNATTTTTVTATRAQANATLQVQVNGGGFSALTSGVASGNLALNVGANPIDVRVTAQDGTTIKTYTITVTRAAATPTVTSNPVNTPVNSTTITINGTGFDTTPGNNTVVFNLGAIGTVTAVNGAGTQLTVTFSTMPTGLGLLTAIVTNGNGNSGAAMTVGTVTVASGAVFYTVTATADNTNATPTGGIGTAGSPLLMVSLRGAVLAANANGVGPHTISVPSGIYNLSIQNPNTPGTSATVNNPDLQVGSHLGTVTIIGTGGTKPQIVQTNQTNTYYATTGNDVFTTGFKGDLSPAIVNLTLNNLDISGGGLTGIFTGADDGTNRSSTTIINCNIHDNTNADASFGQGGAIYNQAGSLTVTGSTFSNNSATNSSTGQGGAIYYNLPNASGQGSQGDLSITGCTFTSNSASVGTGFPAGGAIFVNVVSGGPAISITGNNFITNAATSGNGGAIALLNTTRATNILNNRFIGNAGANGTVLNNASASAVSANTNWWSRNTGPAVGEIGGSPVAATSWLQLKLAASPTTINVGQTSALTASFLSDSANNAVPAANLTALVGQTVTWTGGALGTISSAQTTIQAAGTATATFTGTAGGAASPSAQVDNAPAATASITVNVPDTTPPDTTITGNPSNPTNSTTATFTFTGTDNVTPPGSLTFEAQIDNNGFVAVTSPHTYTGLPDGTRTFQVRARDAAGNPDPTPATFIWTIDTTPPAAPVVVTPANGSTTNDTTPTVTGTAEANSTVTVFFDGSSSGTTPADGSGNWSYTPVAALAPVPHTVKARAADALGNTSVDSNTNAFTVTLTPSVTTPTVAFLTNITASLGGNVTGDGGSAITARGVVYSVTTTNNNPQIGGPGVTVLSDPANTTGVFNVSATGLAQGTGYSFVAYATNANGTTYTAPVSTFTTLTPDYNVTTTGNAIVVTDAAGNSDTLDVTQPGAGNIRFAATGRSFSVNGGVTTTGDSGSLSLGGVTAITVNAAVGADIINVGAFTGTLPSLTINGGTGDDTVNLNGSITFAANANLDLDLQNDSGTPGTDIVNVATNANILTSGTGTITVKVSQNIALAAGSSFETVNGGITLEANQQAVPTSGNFVGINVTTATVKSTGLGTISFAGRGGNDVGTVNHIGVFVTINATISSVGADIVLNGRGGNSTSFPAGVVVRQGATVTTATGNISITGNAGTATAGSSLAYGIYMDLAGTITSSGTGAGVGTITLSGTGNIGVTATAGIAMFHAGTGISAVDGRISVTGVAGAGTGASNHGVNLQLGSLIRTTGTGANAGNITVNGTGGLGTSGSLGVQLADAGGGISTVDGDISVTGLGGAGTGPYNEGVGVFGGGAIRSTGTGASAGTVTVIGTGNGVGGGTESNGVSVRDAGSLITSVDGAISITGTGGTGANTSGVRIGYNAGVAGAVTSTGTAPIAFIADTVFFDTAASINGGANTVTVRPKTLGQIINLGGADTGAQLGLTDAELDRITAGTVQIGNAQSGPITISAVISPANYKTLALARDTTFAATGGFTSDIGPLATNIENITVTGTLTINAGATLATAATGGFVPVNGQSFPILTVSGTTAVSGIFSGLPEQQVINPFLGVAINALITYVGGSGNDVVILTNRPPVPGVVTVTRYPTQPVKIPVATITGAATDPDVGDTISLTSVANGANGTALIASGYVFYTPTGNFPLSHTFNYTIQDNHGATAIGTVTVNVVVDNAAGQNITRLVRLPDGTAVVSFAGIPGLNYGVQYKTILADPSWTDIGPVSVDAFGAATYTDNDPVRKASPSGFYRFIYPAPPAGP